MKRPQRLVGHAVEGGNRDLLGRNVDGGEDARDIVCQSGSGNKTVHDVQKGDNANLVRGVDDALDLHADKKRPTVTMREEHETCGSQDCSHVETGRSQELGSGSPGTVNCRRNGSRTSISSVNDVMDRLWAVTAGEPWCGEQAGMSVLRDFHVPKARRQSIATGEDDAVDGTRSATLARRGRP